MDSTFPIQGLKMDEKIENNTEAVITYIHEEINNLRMNDRVKCIQILDDDGLYNKIMEKPTGSSIRFSDISEETLNKLYDFIEKTLKKYDFNTQQILGL